MKLIQRIEELAGCGKVSDFFLTVGEPLKYYHLGELTTDETCTVHKEDLEEIAEELEIDLDAEGFTDWDGEWSLPNVRFRVNYMRARRELRLVMRVLPAEIPKPDDIHVPASVVEKIDSLRQGLVLVCGPTGSGKSTTLASLIQRIASRRKEHIVTIEDPIEYVLNDEQAIISQRQVGRDVESFAMAVRQAMRQAPKTIFVGEIRDAATAEAVITAAETGHLVFSTMHTPSADQTVQRFLQMVPEERLRYAQVALSDILEVVVCQRLLLVEDDKRAPIHEVMIKNRQMRGFILEGNWRAISNEIDISTRDGMISFKRSIENLADRGLISYTDAQDYLGGADGG